jgi:hypothetical protein
MVILNKIEEEHSFTPADKKEVIHRVVKENGDSLEFGTSKTGVVKIYGNFANEEEFKAKIDKAIACRTYAQLKIKGELLN